MNCSIHAVLHILALLHPQDQAELGQLCHLWGALHHRPRLFDPSRHLQWVMLMSPWRNLFTQHDAAEYIAHMLVRLRLPCLSGRWEARTLETGRDLLQDEGLLHHRLSECVQAWCHQTHTHALAPLCEVPCTWKACARTSINPQRPQAYFRTTGRHFYAAVLQFPQSGCTTLDVSGRCCDPSSGTGNQQWPLCVSVEKRIAIIAS